MSTAEHKYSVALIGAGRIGCGFDAPGSENILTHAHAFSANANTKLVAIVDADAAKGKEEARRWGTTFYAEVEEMYAKEQPDIAVIATPDNTHIDMLERVTALEPKLIICEKPIVADLRDFERAEALVEKVSIVVNFRRRFDPRVSELREELLAGKYGKVLSAVGIYSKGAVHTGVHMLDLVQNLFGRIQNIQPLSHTTDWKGEPTVGGTVTLERCPQLYLVAGDERAYSIFELDILTERKRFRFLDEGLTLATHEVIDDPVYEGYRILGKQQIEKTGLDKAMENLASHAVNVLEGKEKPRVTLADALITERACFSLLDTVSSPL
jgi:predicted dehydrogenase